MCDLEIENLVPYEPAAINDVVEKYRNQIKNGETLDDVRIVRMAIEEQGEEIGMVMDGNNRVKALQLEGVTRVSVSNADLSNYDMDDVRWTFNKRLRDGMRGFSGLSLVDTAEQRKEMTNSEISERLNDELLRNLQAAEGEDSEES